MPIQTIILLGAIAGFTIYLGLPLARVKTLSSEIKGFLSMLATGVLLYLLVDITSKMMEPIEGALTEIGKDPGNLASGLTHLAIMVAGVFIGLVGIPYLSKAFHGRKPADGKHSAAEPHEISPENLSLIIAIGIGAHNLSEGLAIGQAAISGSLQLAWLLIIGFGLHNMTEGFGIAGPLGGRTVSWKFLGLLGLIGGGPTFLGTVLGIAFHSTALFILSLAFAAGAIVYVVMELMGSARRFPRTVVAWGLFVGFLLALGTDLLLSVAGA